MGNVDPQYFAGGAQQFTVYAWWGAGGAHHVYTTRGDITTVAVDFEFALGPTGSGSHLHTHEAAWNGLVYGVYPRQRRHFVCGMPVALLVLHPRVCACGRVCVL